MIPAEVLGTLFVASVVLALAPGPDNIFVLTQSALHGRSAGLIITMGLCTGLFVHTAAVAFGVAAIFQTTSYAFTILKAVGAAYLLYLAWQAFRAAALKIPSNANIQLSAAQLYRRGIVMNVTNPKVSIFFLAFLPQFADPARGPLVLQLLVFGAVFMLATILVFGSVALSAGFVGEWFSQSPRAQRVMNYMAGTVLAGLAIKLALTEK
jgi:threonine/homoserine/homoserine lactone efflux protein